MLVFALVAVPALAIGFGAMILSTLIVSGCAFGFRDQEARHKATVMTLAFSSFTLVALSLALIVVLNANPFLWPGLACNAACR